MSRSVGTVGHRRAGCAGSASHGDALKVAETSGPYLSLVVALNCSTNADCTILFMTAPSAWKYLLPIMVKQSIADRREPDVPAATGSPEPRSTCRSPPACGPALKTLTK
jgi:hypothetical protein